MKTPLLTAAIFLTTHLLPVTALPPPNSSSTYLTQTADGEDNTNTPQEVQAQAQKITVRITSADNGGSGVLIAKKGTTYLVLTNKHVVGKTTKFQIQTPDGQKHTAQLVPNTQIDPKYDAALLQFTSRQSYTLANLKYDTGTPLTEGREIYSAGFPFDSERLRFTTGSVTQLSDVPLEDGTQIGYITNPGQKGIRQGMSGGPVLDGNGTVIGINTIGAAPILPSYTYFDGSKPLPTKATEYAKANWGVPIYNVLTQLNPDILYNYENLPKVQRQVTPQGYMAELNRKARQQTVRIEFQDIKNGSGVIVAKEGNTYYVLTAKHVVWNSNNKSFHSTNIKTITDDQQSYAVQPSDITLAEGSDIAIVKFTAATNYPVAKIGNYNSTSGEIVFVGGYPARDRIDSPLWQWQLNPGVILDKEQGKLATQDKLSFSDGYDLIYSSISYGGMSGGPVFDTDGRVIGIHGRVEGESEKLILGNSLGISIQTFLGLTQRLQVPNSLAVSSKRAESLSEADKSTVIAIRDNIAPPQNDSSGEQWLQYGNQLYRIGKYPEASAAFDRAIATGDKKYQLLGNYGKARALWSTNNELALSAIERAIAALPAKEQRKYYYFWKYQGIILRELGKDEDALKSIEIAIKLEPNDLILLHQKAGILIPNYQKEATDAIYDIVLSKAPEKAPEDDAVLPAVTVDDWNKAIALNLYDAKAYYSRGHALADLRQFRRAIADYNQVISFNPNFYRVYYDRGNAKANLREEQAAIADYNKAISLHPNFAEAYYNRGVVKYQLRQKQAAIADYDKAISLNPNNAQAYSNRGVIKSSLGQKQAAIADYDKAISLNPNDVQTYYNRGNVKSELGKKQAAIADYDKAISLNPNVPLAYYIRGLIKYDLGQKQAAIADYDKAISLHPNYAEAYYNRGVVKAKLGQKQAAIGDLTKAAKLFRQQGQMNLYESILDFIQKIKG